MIRRDVSGAHNKHDFYALDARKLGIVRKIASVITGLSTILVVFLERELGVSTSGCLT